MATTGEVEFKDRSHTRELVGLGVAYAVIGLLVGSLLVMRNDDGLSPLLDGAWDRDAFLRLLTAVVWWAWAFVGFREVRSAKVTVSDGLITARRGARSERTFAVDEISGVSLGVFRAYRPRWEEQGKGPIVRPVIVLKDQGQRIGLYPLGSHSVLESGAPGPKEEPRARQIADVLGVPYLDPAESAAATVASEADAVAR
ncbi:MAG: hypothetical protein FWD59_09220 [Micrococcales bacterium]|nr:hypothetical protein [Micrococcales bacterium]